MLSILLDNGKKYTQYHIQLLLSFIGVKHAHIQYIIDTLQDTIDPNKSISLDELWKRIHQYLLDQHYSTSIHDLNMAWTMTQRQDSVCILLGGTSGCGKSTLASLLAHRMGITTVLSTDHVRSLLRSFDTDKSQSILWASSYQASKTISNITTSSSSSSSSSHDSNNNSNNSNNHHLDKEEEKKNSSNKATVNLSIQVNSNSIEDYRQNHHLVVQGYEAQNQIILPTLDKMIHAFYQRKENLVIEGVALSTTVMRSLVKKYQHCIPLLVYIGNEQKHMERFAIRAKYMTVAPKANKYIHYFDNIRLIQQHLCQEADLWRIPKVNNTNVDRSLAIVHTTVIQVLSQLRKKKRFNPSTPLNAFSQDILFTIYSNVYESTWSSKQMLRRIRKSQSSSTSSYNHTTTPNNSNNYHQQIQKQKQPALSPLSMSSLSLSSSIIDDNKKRKSTPSSSPTYSSSSKKRCSKASSTPPTLSPILPSTSKRNKSYKRSDPSSPYINDLDYLDDSAWGSLTS